jgi:hypothetical protein
MRKVKIIGEVSFDGWVRKEALGAHTLLQLMIGNGAFYLDTQNGLGVQFHDGFNTLSFAIDGPLWLPDPETTLSYGQDDDVEETEKAIAALRKAADGLQQALDKRKATIEALKEQPVVPTI